MCHRAEAAAENQQLTPGIDQQGDLVVYQDVLEQRKTLAPLDKLVQALRGRTVTGAEEVAARSTSEC